MHNQLKVPPLSVRVNNFWFGNVVCLYCRRSPSVSAQFLCCSHTAPSSPRRNFLDNLASERDITDAHNWNVPHLDTRRCLPTPCSKSIYLPLGDNPLTFQALIGKIQATLVIRAFVFSLLFGCETWYLTAKGKTQSESVWEQDREENIWIYETESNKRTR